LKTGRIRRREHFRTHFDLVLSGRPGVLASEVLGPIQSKLKDLQNSLPPGYQLQIAGEKAKQDGRIPESRRRSPNLSCRHLPWLYLCNSRMPFKPLLVFAAAPVRSDRSVDRSGDHGYALRIHGHFLGVAQSHRGHRQPCDRIVRLHRRDARKGRATGSVLFRMLGLSVSRPVMITVGATILALFPLALEGGPLWKTSLLCADRWTCCRYLHHVALGSCLLRDFCPGSEVDYLGTYQPKER